MATPVITADMLRAKGACFKQVELFERTFPNGVEVTLENAQKYGALFNLDWAAEHLLRRPARDDYDAVMRPALAAYEAAVDSAWRAYDEANRQTRAAYDAAERPAWRAYQAARAVAFARAYIEQERNGGE